MSAKNHSTSNQQKNMQPPSPLTGKEEVAKNPDPKIDQDFQGFPHGSSKENLIRPKTDNDKKTADLIKKNETGGEQNPQAEQASDGSANGFERTELDPENDLPGENRLGDGPVY